MSDIQVTRVDVLEENDEGLVKQPADEAGVEYADLRADTTAVVKEPVVVAKEPVVVAKAPEDTAEEPIPDDLKGKTPAQLAKMYQDARRVIGRQGHELGEVRRLADSYIKANLTASQAARTAAAPEKPAPTKEEREVEFFAKPTEAVDRAISDHPDVKKFKEATERVLQERAIERAQAAQTKFNAEFPDAASVLADPEFQAYINASKTRQRLLVHADKTFDLDAAQEIFGTWKEVKGARAVTAAAAAAKTAAAAAEAKKQTARAAAVPSGTNAGGKDTGSGKKIYRRADILDLMENHPAKYEALIDEIQLAYAEKRVR